ncbi:MAG: enoyl-CoA hydratase/isomerase family protein [Nitrososphaerota archaeon]
MKIISEKKDNVYWLTLNREDKANAIDIEMWEGLKNYLEDASNDQDIRIVAITGKGRYFSAGEDLNDLYSASSLDASLSLFIKHIKPVFDIIVKSGKVITAVVNGPALGVGVELVLACDLAIAHSESYFMLSQGRVGVGPALALSLAPTSVSRKRMIEMLLTSKKVDAKLALQWGLINDIYIDDAEGKVKSWAKEIGKVPESLVKITKERLSKHLYNFDYDSSFREIAEYVLTKETKEGIKSFLERK